MAAITNVLDTHIPSGEQSFVSKTVGAQSPVTVNDPPAPQRLKQGKKSPSVGGQAKISPVFQQQSAPAKKKRPTRTRAQKDARNARDRANRAKKAAA